MSTRECGRCKNRVVEHLPCRWCADEDAALLASPSITYHTTPDEGPALRALLAGRQADYLTQAQLDAAALGDVVKKPNHYIKNGIEVVLVCEAFLPGEVELVQVAQYVLRAPHKGNRVEDLKKAKQWLGRAIAIAEGRPGSWE